MGIGHRAGADSPASGRETGLCAARNEKAAESAAARSRNSMHRAEPDTAVAAMQVHRHVTDIGWNRRRWWAVQGSNL